MNDSKSSQIDSISKATSSSSVLIDWTSTRKRTSDTNKEQEDTDQVIEQDEPEVEEDSPFSFVKKARRCKLECCSTLWALASTEGGHETLNLSEVCIVFLPPPCEVSWFSGICSFNSRETIQEKEEDPFMETNVHEVTEVSAMGSLSSSKGSVGILGHELEIDDCLKCADGGYQNFRFDTKSQHIFPLFFFMWFCV